MVGSSTIVLDRTSERRQQMNSQKILPQILLRSWPFPRGAGRIIDHFFSQLTFENEVETVRTTDGFAIKVFPNDLIGRHIH